MTNSPLRVGIVGANVSGERPSWGARAHLPALLALPEIEVVAVCTTQAATAEETARRFGIPQAFSDAQTMLAEADIDVLDVCVNVVSHHDLVMLGLDAGKHVFCEWPLGATLAETTELRDRAAAAGVRTMVGLQARTAPVYVHMRELISNGYVGDVLSCTVNGSMAMTPSPRSAALALIHAGHALDTLFAVVGDEIDRGACEVSIDSLANHVLVIGRLTSGAFVNVSLRHVPVFTTGFTFEVNGTDGTLVASIAGSTLAERDVRSLGEQINQAGLKGARKGEPISDIPTPAHHRWVPDAVPSGPPVSLAQLWRRFAEAIRSDTDVEPDFALAVRRHELFDTLVDHSARSFHELRNAPTAEVASDHDFFDAAYVRRWAEQADTNNPDRTALIEAFVDRASAYASKLGRELTVLELGPGAGRLAGQLLTRAPISRYFLLDFSTPMLEFAREHLGDDSRAAYIQADFRDSTWPDRIPEPVDVIVTMQAVHELRHASRVPDLYARMLRTMEPGGLLLLCDHLRPADDERPLFLTAEEHISLLADVGMEDVEVVHRSETKVLLSGYTPSDDPSPK